MPQTDLVAIALLLALAATLVGWIVVARGRSGYTWAEAFWYLVNTLFTKLLWRTQISRPLPLPPGQGAIIVSNHISGVDPLLIQLTTRRKVHWMVAREYVQNAFMAWPLRTVGSIPVNRGGVDTAATKLAIRLARQGELVGMFPEGRINLEPNKMLLLPGRPGSAFVAIKARVPVIPVYVSGSPYDGTALGSFFMSAHARVIVGDPIDISAYYDQDEKEVLAELTRRFLVEIARLAGRQDFQPRIAGRRWKWGADDENGALENEKTSA